MSSVPLTVTTLRWREPYLHNWTTAQPAESVGGGRDWALAVTILRAPLGMLGALAIVSGYEVTALTLLVTFAGVDLIDGMLARRAGKETGFRRLSDVLIDRLTIHAVVLSIAPSVPHGYALFGAFLIRDMIQAVVSGSFVVQYRTVLVGPYSHMSYGLAMLAWVVAALTGFGYGMWLNTAVLTISTVVLLDFVRRTALIAEQA